MSSLIRDNQKQFGKQVIKESKLIQRCNCTDNTANVSLENSRIALDSGCQEEDFFVLISSKSGGRRCREVSDLTFSEIVDEYDDLSSESSHASLPHSENGSPSSTPNATMKKFGLRMGRIVSWVASTQLPLSEMNETQADSDIEEIDLDELPFLMRHGMTDSRPLIWTNTSRQ